MLKATKTDVISKIEVIHETKYPDFIEIVVPPTGGDVVYTAVHVVPGRVIVLTLLVSPSSSQ